MSTDASHFARLNTHLVSERVIQNNFVDTLFFLALPFLLRRAEEISRDGFARHACRTILSISRERKRFVPSLLGR